MLGANKHVVKMNVKGLWELRFSKQGFFVFESTWLGMGFQPHLL